MDHEVAHRVIVERVREGLAAIAALNMAEFVDTSRDDKAEGAPSIAFRLVPKTPEAASIEVMPDDAWSTYIDVGRGGWFEVFTSPKKPDRGIQDTLDIVEAVVAGRLRERVWRRKKTGEHVGSLLYIQLKPGDRWRLIGEVGRPLPIVRRWRYDEEVVHYKPYLASHT